MKTNELNYRILLCVLESMLAKEVIKPDEFECVRQILLEKYEPYISQLLI